MYLLFGFFLIICIIFLCLGFYRKKCVIRKIYQMSECQKVCLLNEILTPFGFFYEAKQDIIITTIDAWQKAFGYRSGFDRSALHFGMVFDCEPIFFYYKGRTYRVELWKGQYGINLGGEVGIYYADGILTPEEFDTASFKSVSVEEMLMIEMTLCHKGQKLFTNAQKHWWLAGFCMGKYCEPENLTMRVSITFIDSGMVSCFVNSLCNMGYQVCDITICDCTVSFVFSCPHTRQPRHCRCFRVCLAQWKNRLFCRLFLRVTKCFSRTLERILFLYFFLPVAFRHMFLHKRNRRQKFSKKKRAVHLRGI